MDLDVNDLDERIRKRAYHLWEAEGRPEGRDAEFWERARELMAAEDNPVEDNPMAGQLANPMQTNQVPRANPVQVRGDTTDQGEREKAPARRRRKAQR